MILNVSNYKTQLTSLNTILINDIINNIENRLPFYRLNDKTPLERALLKGQVKYTGFHFQGYFFQEVKEELLKLGATKSSVGYYLQQSALPEYIKEAIKKNKRKTEEIKDIIVSIISGFSIVSVFTSNNYVNLIKKIKEDLNLTDKKRENNFVKKYNEELKDGLSETLQNIANEIKDKDFNTQIEVINTIKNRLRFNINNKIDNITNINLFEVQEEQAKEEGRKGFYWLQINRPTKRKPHAVYCKHSLQGHMFYFDNLPIENGERVYPRKLYNCRCDAILDRKEFLLAIKNNHS